MKKKNVLQQICPVLHVLSIFVYLMFLFKPRNQWLKHFKQQNHTASCSPLLSNITRSKMTKVCLVLAPCSLSGEICKSLSQKQVAGNEADHKANSNKNTTLFEVTIRPPSSKWVMPQYFLKFQIIAQTCLVELSLNLR